MAGVFYKDFLIKFFKEYISDRKATNILKLIVILIGCTSVDLVFLMEHLGEVKPLLISMTAMFAGPSMGMFTLGVFFPKANAKVKYKLTNVFLLITFLGCFLWCNLWICCACSFYSPFKVLSIF